MCLSRSPQPQLVCGVFRVRTENTRQVGEKARRSVSKTGTGSHPSGVCSRLASLKQLADVRKKLPSSPVSCQNDPRYHVGTSAVGWRDFEIICAPDLPFNSVNEAHLWRGDSNLTSRVLYIPAIRQLYCSPRHAEDEDYVSIYTGFV